MKRKEKNRRINRNFWSIALGRTTAIIILTLLSAGTFACDFCNKKFYEELLSSRKNSLIAKELLASINSQRGFAAGPAGTGAGGGLGRGDAQGSGEKKEFIEIINRDNRLPIPATSYVPQNTKPDTSVTIELSEGDAYLGKGVLFKGFVTNGQIPGPTIIVEEGQVVEFNVVNKGNIPHGASIHSAYTQTSKYLGKIIPGETKKMVFKVTIPGVYMYHCAPGGHAIPMHILFGQYGMMVVKPKKKYKLEQILGKKPDVEIYLNQHEWYASGKDAIDGKPLYTTFNGKIFRYVEEPIKAKPGDYVRIYYMNTGPNQLATFHIVGIIWDFAYWQGNPDVVYPGGQSVTAGPTDSWVIDFRMPPDEGAFLFLTHAVGSTDRGAIGILACDQNAKTPVTVLADGPKYTEAEMKEFRSKAIRTISPFEPGSMDVDPPAVFGSETKEVTVKIIGNSFFPKRLKIAPGTTVKWINEDVFAYMEGEFAGIHNSVATKGPETWASPLLAHAETYTFKFTKEGEYEYMCTPHPYMKGAIEVVESEGGSGGGGGSSTTAITISVLAMLLSLGLFFMKKS